MKFLKKIFTTQGRLNRLPYNMYSFALLAISFVTIFLMSMLQGVASTIEPISALAFGLLAFIVGMAAFIGQVTLTIRRLHDLNLSGWYYLLYIVFSILPAVFYNEESLTMIFIALVFSLVSLILPLFVIFKRGTAGENKYGKDPLSE